MIYFGCVFETIIRNPSQLLLKANMHINMYLTCCDGTSWSKFTMPLSWKSIYIPQLNQQLQRKHEWIRKAKFTLSSQVKGFKKDNNVKWYSVNCYFTGTYKTTILKTIIKALFVCLPYIPFFWLMGLNKFKIVIHKYQMDKAHVLGLISKIENMFLSFYHQVKKEKVTWCVMPHISKYW